MVATRTTSWFSLGTKHAKGITEAIIAAIREEIGTSCNQPVLIIGDFNATPSSFNGIAELMEEEAWIDVGPLRLGGEVPTTNQHAPKEPKHKRPG